MLDRDGEPTEAVPFMGELTIATTRRPDVDVHRIRLDIYRTDGIHVGGTEHFVEDGEPARRSATGCPTVLLAPATYDVSVHAYDHGGVVPRRPLPHVPLRRHLGPHPRSPRADRDGWDLVARCLTTRRSPGPTSGHARGGARRRRHGRCRPGGDGVAGAGPARPPRRRLASVAIAAAVRLGILALGAARGPPARRRPAGARAGRTRRRSASLFMSLPGFPYAYADKDPGIYVVHALAIARDGDAIARRPGAGGEPTGGAVSRPAPASPGVWTEGDAHSTSQFFHFFSSLTATAVDLTDERAAFHLNALLGALVGRRADARRRRRAFGLPTAAIAGGLLVISLPQVWQTKYPTTEILAQLLLGGAMLAGVHRRRPSVPRDGLRGRDRWWASASSPARRAAAGGHHDRGRGPAARAGPGRPPPCAVVALGLALTLPYALLNAYGLRRSYTLANDVPDLPIVAVGVIAGLLRGPRAPPGGHPCRAVVRGPHQPALARHRARRRAAAGPPAVLRLRERLLGEAYSDLLGPEPVRSLDELNLRRLSLLPDPLRVAARGGGPRRGRPPAMAHRPVGSCSCRASACSRCTSGRRRSPPRLMWWVRRFVPGVVPVVAAAGRRGPGLVPHPTTLGLAGRRCCRARRPGGRPTSIGPGRSETTGRWAARTTWRSRSPRAAGDRQGLFLWEAPVPRRPLRSEPQPPRRGVVGLRRARRLPSRDPTQAVVDEYAARFPEQPVFVVSGSEELPGGLDPGRLRASGPTSRRVLPVWEEAILSVLPDGPMALPQSSHRVAV